MRRILDYDPLSDTSVVFNYDEATDVMTIDHVQDVEPFLKKAAELRADEERTKRGIKNDLVHYAIIPEAIQLELKYKHGVDIDNRNDWPKLYRLLNSDYQKFKVTNIVHNIKG